MDSTLSGAPAGAGLAAGGGGVYPDSVDSSPGSHGGESWDEPFPSPAAAAIQPTAKLRLMCSYGGHIVPRPHDKSLCYLGGDTRIVVVDRHTTLADLSAKLSRSLLGGRPFSLKYQLPSEDLDSLISVTTDEDLENMIEEYDRIVSNSSHGSGGAGGGGGSGGANSSSGKPSRLRLFLFPAKVESSAPSSIGSLLDDSKSETWFVDALNGTIGMLPRGLSQDSAASSVNCLLGLEDDHNASSAAAAAGHVAPPLQQVGGDPLHHQQMQLPRSDSSGKLAGGKQRQEVHSVPDSPMLDTSSSFGSASSAPYLSILPPIRVRPDDMGPDQRGFGGGLEEHFSQMNVSGQKQEDGFVKDGAFVPLHQYPPPPPPFNPAVAPPHSTVASTTPVISPTENHNDNNRVFSSDDEKSEHGGVRNPPQSHPQPPFVQQPQKPSAFDLPVSERPSYYPERNSPGASGLSPGSDTQQEVQSMVQDPNYRVQMQVSEQGYMLPIPPEQFHQLQQQPQLQLQQPPQPHPLQQQYVHANPHLVQHHASTQVIPLQSFYQMHPPMHPQQQLPQAHPYNSQMPMYFLPVHSNTAYTLPMQQPNLADTTAATPASKPSLPFLNSVLPAQGATPPPPKPELVAPANISRTGAATAAPVAQPPSTPQLIHIADQTHQQYVGYHPMHHHPSQATVPASYRYEFSGPVHTQPQMYYTQTASMPMPSLYQTVSSAAATMISDVPSQLQQADVKQTRASS